MVKRVVIVGGGTAGWMTAAYLARMLSADMPGGIQLSLIESEEIGTIGVGEGTFPSIRKTLQRLGIDEFSLVSKASATFKQGVKFVNWKSGPESPDSYLHGFQVSDLPSGLQLLPYWLVGVAGERSWDQVATPQWRVVADGRAPKQYDHADYTGPLAYAYHFDAVELAKLLKLRALSTGVQHISDTVVSVNLTVDGAIKSVGTRLGGEVDADFFIDCSGFKAQLIDGAMKSPFKSCRNQIFANRAVAMQMPYEQPDAPIASATIATAQMHGWTWDIGLSNRKGIGYVYSSDHCSDDSAESVLRTYAGASGQNISTRILKFEAGYRPSQWVKNCVSIGLASGFIEPLEATGIGFIEVAALYLATLFPWDGPVDAGAVQFNSFMSRRYENSINFIKLHYAISQRADSEFWHDNREASTISDDLLDRLARWRYRVPDFADVDLSVDIFTPANWQYVLYGMGFKTDLSARVGALKFYDEARAAFTETSRQADYALSVLPKNRDLVSKVAARHPTVARQP